MGLPLCRRLRLPLCWEVQVPKNSLSTHLPQQVRGLVVGHTEARPQLLYLPHLAAAVVVIAVLKQPLRSKGQASQPHH